VTIRLLAVAACVALAALSPAASYAQQAGQSVPGPAYRINPGDDLEILVWGDERLQRSVRVLPDGTFAFPLVGQVVAAGRLPAELERVIATGLQPQYRGPVPQVTVSVKNPSGFQFSVVGKVRSPGTYTPGRYVNALEALAIAGGPTEFAQLSNVRIIRKSGQRLVTIRVRVNDTLRGETSQISAAELPPVESGDTLVVP
jgi:polysaccharide biosynthesis/export protein